MAGKRDAYYDKALDLFLDGQTIAEIAALLPVSRKEIGKWSADDDWAAMRKDLSGSKRSMQRKLLAVMNAKVRAINPHDVDLNVSVADELYKFWKIINDAEADSEEQLKSARVDVMVEFLQFCHARQEGQHGIDKAQQHGLINAFLAEKVEGA